MLIISFLKSIIHSFNHSFYILHSKFYITKFLQTKRVSMPLLVLIIQTLLFTAGCKQTTEPKLDAELTLELEDVSCTEAWIKLTTNNIQLPATINLLKNNSISQVYVLSTQDSLLYIDSLLPNQTYKFKVVLNATNNPQPTTNELTVTTMDTTSHNFTWQTFTFGEPGAGSSTLYDVAIIDENNIWAVGEIYLLDSLGNPDPNAYNAVHWNGQQWELKRIPIYLPSGYPFYPVIKSVFAFNSNDIWFEAGIHWDGNSFKQIPFNIQWSGNVNKLWGSSSEDLFAVGNNGNIAHWDGRKWTKIESGTDLRINDIWGDYNEKTGKTEILAIA
ncbi:MAG: glucosyl transferase, partial [Ignavibacterium sp.]|uniref:glucosyl transferase n=1 Tax=Ignavibacterium sp. TaxID=2651167 RepID=UPI003297DEE5